MSLSPFTLWLRNEETEERLCVPLPNGVADALAVQWGRCQSADAYEDWVNRLSAAVHPAVSSTLDPDLRLPTSAQLNYAVGVARRYGVALPSDALRFRGAMRSFLQEFEAD